MLALIKSSVNTRLHIHIVSKILSEPKDTRLHIHIVHICLAWVQDTRKENTYFYRDE